MSESACVRAFVRVCVYVCDQVGGGGGGLRARAHVCLSVCSCMCV